MTNDVVVVGGGAVGLCVALSLADAGRGVTVLSREPVGVGASAGNAGMLVPSHVVPLSAPGVVAKGLRWLTNPESPFFIRPRADLELGRWLWRFWRSATPEHVARSVPVLRDLSLASVEGWRELQETLGDVGFEPTGLVMLHHTPKGEAANLADAATAEAAGLDVERLDARQLRDLDSGLRWPATGGVLYRQDGRADPERFLQQLADALRQRGVEIREGVTATGLRTSGGRVTAVVTDRGDVEAGEVVLAAGSWTAQLARTVGLRVPLQPAKGFSLTVDAPEGGPWIPAILTEEKLTITPLPGRLRFAGTLALAGFDAAADARRLAPIRRLVEAYAPEAEAEAWVGFRPCSPDGLPVVGRSPRHAGLTLATGHGMMGLTLAPVTGRLVADVLSGRTPSLDLAPFAPGRF